MKRICLPLVTSLFLAACILPAKAWNAEGHMVVAQYAYGHLLPDVKARCDTLMALNVFGVGNSNNTFVTSAAWADDIKSFTSEFSNWHFIDLPFSLDGTSTNSFVTPLDNVVWAISNCVVALQDPSTSISNQAVNLRFLVHFVGDIHQPLHSSTAISAAHPGGDAGGNSFLLSGNPGNLHSLWDQGAGYLTDSLPRPLNGAGQTTLSNKVLDVETAYPYTTGFVTIPNSMNWALEGWRLAQSVVYVGITAGSTPTSGYLATGQSTTKQRMAVGGQRLADLLNIILSTNNAVTPLQIFASSQTANGPLKITFTNQTGASFHVFTTTNLTNQFSNWTLLGAAAESPAGSGHFQFTDTQVGINPKRFYRVHSP